MRVKLPRFSLQDEPWLCQRIPKCLFSALISSSWPQPEHRWIIDTGILQWFASRWAGEVWLVLGLSCWFLLTSACLPRPPHPAQSRTHPDQVIRRHDGTAAWRRACRRSAHKRAHLSASPKMTRVASTGREPRSPGNVGCLCCHPWLMESSGTRIVTVTQHFSYFKMTSETKKRKNPIWRHFLSSFPVVLLDTGEPSPQHPWCQLFFFCQIKPQTATMWLPRSWNHQRPCVHICPFLA